MLDVQLEVQIEAPREHVFDCLTRRIGAWMTQQPGGASLDLALEAWPGGRLYRDLGDNAGHFWAHVQVIRPPQLLELTGPLFMSIPAVNHLSFELTQQGDATIVRLHHRALGAVENFAPAADVAWNALLCDGLKPLAETDQ